MNRPLAAAGFAALGVLLLALGSLPPAALCPLAAVLLILAAGALAWCLVRRRWKGGKLLMILCLAAGLALLRLQLAETRTERLRQLVDGAPHTVQGAVYQVGEGLYDAVVSAQLRVETLDGSPCRPFTVQCSDLPAAEVGQLLELEVEFSDFTGSYRLQQYGRGVTLRALLKSGEVQLLGEGRGLLLAAARLRQALARRFLVLGRTRGGLAAAMAVGERSFLDAGISGSFRAAGVSHVLVVSGLHLSLLCLGVGALLRRLLRGRVWPAGLLTMLCVAAYMLLTGLTVSILRAGILALMALSAPLFLRAADTLNSLGLALLVLLAVNPYAACDYGLLLSFGATLGVLCFSTLDSRHFHLRRLGVVGKGLQALGTATFATLFTLPVLAVQGTTLSAATLVCNLLVVPLVLPTMAVSWLFLLTHLVSGSARLLVSGRLLSLLLDLLQGIVRTADRLFVSRLGVSGLAASGVLVCAGLVTFILYHSRLRRWCALAGGGCLLALWGLSAALNAGTVQIALVGGGVNPAAVVSRDGQSVVLFRGTRANLAAVEEYLQQHNLRAPQLVVDLADNGNSELVRQSLGRLDVNVRQDVDYTATLPCLAGVELLLVRQQEGQLCYIQLDGCSVGLNAGPVSLRQYPPCSVYLVGHSRADGLRTRLMVGCQSLPDWLPLGPVYTGEQPLVWLRGGLASWVLDAQLTPYP